MNTIGRVETKDIMTGAEQLTTGKTEENLNRGIPKEVDLIEIVLKEAEVKESLLMKA